MTAEGSIIDSLYKLSISMVNYEYTDQLTTMKPLCSNEKLCWNEALCRNEYLTDWCKFEC